MAEKDDQITVYDGYGREFLIPKDKWRTEVLPSFIQENWNDLDALFVVLGDALQNDCAAEIAEAAKQFYHRERTARGACLLGGVLMARGRAGEAQQLFETFTAKRGEDGFVLVNLSKLYYAKGEVAKADDALWRGLVLDPNQDGALSFYVAREVEKNGEPAHFAALERLANIPGSWRAQIFLAREELRLGRLDSAVGCYRDALHNAKEPSPPELLMSMSGDLGRAGYLRQIIDLVEPHFDVKLHGSTLGNNLIKAHYDLGEFDAARALLNKLYALGLPNLRKGLDFWDSQIGEAVLKARIVDPQRMQIAMLRLDGAIWLSDSSPANSLFPGPPENAPRLAFIGSTTEVENAVPYTAGLPNASGRMSRALPLFLAEQAFMAVNVRVTTFVPFAMQPAPGFAVQNSARSDETIAAIGRRCDPPAEFIAAVHLVAKGEVWRASLRVIRTADAVCVGSVEVDLPPERPEASVLSLSRTAFEIFAGTAGFTTRQRPVSYVLPEGNAFASYLTRLGQLLPVRISGMQDVGAGILHAPREILDGNIRLNLACSSNVPARILLAETLARMGRTLPEVVEEYREKVTLLEREHPLPGLPGDIANRMLAPFMK